MGAIAAALDVTAGERERQTLEPLLATPVTVPELTIGKWLAVSGVNLIAVSVSLLGFVLALQVVPIDRLGLPFSFGLRGVRWIHGRAGAVRLHGACGAARLRRRRQNRQGSTELPAVRCLDDRPLPLMSFFRQTKAPWWDTWVPVNGQYAVLSKVLRSETITSTDWLA